MIPLFAPNLKRKREVITVSKRGTRKGKKKPSRPYGTVPKSEGIVKYSTYADYGNNKKTIRQKVLRMLLFNFFLS